MIKQIIAAKNLHLPHEEIAFVGASKVRLAGEASFGSHLGRTRHGHGRLEGWLLLLLLLLGTAPEMLQGEHLLAK